MVKIFINDQGDEKMMQIFSGASSGAWFEKAQRFGKSFMLPIAVLPAAAVHALHQQFHFYDWNESSGEVRWMTSFDTTAEQVDAFAAAIQAACQEAA